MIDSAAEDIRLEWRWANDERIALSTSASVRIIELPFIVSGFLPLSKVAGIKLNESS